MRKILLISLTMGISEYALAASGEIPMAFIKLQIMNFAVFVALIVLLSKTKIGPAFKQIKEDYIEKSQEAQKKLEVAKAERDELINRIAKLETDFKANIAKAEEQAEAKYKSKIVEVKENIQAMNKDLEGQIEGLKRSQAVELKNLLMKKSIDELKAELNSDVDEDLLIQLQNNFVDNVGARV